jgi:hypothetical protein
MKQVIDEFGNKFWYNKNNEMHREDGPAAEYFDGTKTWRIDGRLHREDGPALEAGNGNKHWYIHGKRHREDGPAIEIYNGNKYWFINDEEIDCKDNKEFLRIVKLKALL